MKRFFRLAVLMLMAWVGCILAACVGCGGLTPVQPEQAGEPAPSPFNREPYDRVLILAVDESKSFEPKMQPGGPGLALANTAIDKYLSGGAGENNYLIVTSMSGSFQSVLWAGPPRQLQNDFANIGVWDELLKKKADAQGSSIWDGLSDSLEIVMGDASMWANGKTRVVLLALTDMENNIIHNYTSEPRLTKDLKAFAKGGAVIGFYFVSTRETIHWRQVLPDMGFKDFVVAPEAETKPRLPKFDE